MSHDDAPDWKVERFPFTDAGALTVAAMKVGYLVKFDATRANVLGAVGADDAVLEGVIADLPDNTDVPSAGSAKTVLVALEGSFDKNTVKYADGTTPISVTGVTRLRDISFLAAQAVEQSHAVAARFTDSLLVEGKPKHKDALVERITSKLQAAFPSTSLKVTIEEIK
jgi:hypothetical protein